MFYFLPFLPFLPPFPLLLLAAATGAATFAAADLAFSDLPGCLGTSCAILSIKARPAEDDTKFQSGPHSSMESSTEQLFLLIFQVEAWKGG